MTTYFSQSELRSAGRYKSDTPSGRTLVEAAIRSKTGTTVISAFLCHSHIDRDLAKGVESFLRDKGVDVYIDWLDTEMSERPDRRTAQRIKDKIGTCDWFMFLATENSRKSRWCPWEIGYADREKTPDRVIIVPTKDDQGHNHGNEYLDLYPHLEKSLVESRVVYGSHPVGSRSMRSVITGP